MLYLQYEHKLPQCYTTAPRVVLGSIPYCSLGTNGRNGGLSAKSRDNCSGYGAESNRAASCSLTISYQRIAGSGGVAGLSISSPTSAAALPRTLLSISHARIAGSENRRLPTSIRCGTRLRLRSV